MASAAIPAREHIVLRGISWETYETIAEEIDEQHVRLIYDRGTLELMSPSTHHERFKKLLGHIAAEVMVGLDIPFEEAGESRWKRALAQRGLEADETYYLAPEKLAIMEGRPAYRPDDPLPDLAIEVDWSDAAIDRESIYAALGIPELWKFDGDLLRILHLRDDGTFEDARESRFLPITADEVTEWVGRASGVNVLNWIKELREWIAEELVPRLAADDH